MIFYWLNRKNNLFIEQCVTANLQPKSNKAKQVIKQYVVNNFLTTDNRNRQKQLQNARKNCADNKHFWYAQNIQ